MLERLRIVLCGTTHPGNIGAAARAMKTMGLTRLELVAPAQYPSAEATARASGADDVLQRARVSTSLAEALDGVTWAAGTTARLRAIPMPTLGPREAVGMLARESAYGEVALVFGRERTGLTNAEIDRCQALVRIPTSPTFASLNLAAAVQVLCYEIRLAVLAGQEPPAPAPWREDPPAPVPAVEGFFAHLEQALVDIRFLDPRQSETMLTRLRRLFNRARPSDTELNILRGILARVQQAARRNGEPSGMDDGPDARHSVRRRPPTDR